MSFDHKAFEFDWHGFSNELAPLLHQVLAQDKAEELCRFIEDNLSHCSNPYDGEPLEAGWQSSLEAADVQAFADFALTRYYEPLRDFGLAGGWQDLAEALDQEQQAALLGEAFGPSTRLFDPGRQGSYFQTPEQVNLSLHRLSGSEQEEIAAFRGRLALVAANGKGVYVTF